MKDEERAEGAFLRGELRRGRDEGSNGWKRQGRKKAAGRRGQGVGVGGGQAGRTRRSITPEDRSWAWGRARRKEPQRAQAASGAGQASLSGTLLAARGEKGAGLPRRAGRGGEGRGGKSEAGLRSERRPWQGFSRGCRVSPRVARGARRRLPVPGRAVAPRG